MEFSGVTTARAAGAERGPRYQARPTFVCRPVERTRSCCSTGPTLSGGEGSFRLRVSGVLSCRTKERDGELESPAPEPWGTLRLGAQGSAKAYKREKLESPAPEPWGTLRLGAKGSAKA
jgi:hypothetical protein